MIPEPSANMNDMWFYVNHAVDRSILCNHHLNGEGDEMMPHDYIKTNYDCGKTCVACSASETGYQYSLWPPEWQRQTITKMAARIPESERSTSITDPQGNFAQFLKDITYAMVGNKRIPYGEILLKAVSHFGLVRVPRDRVTQIFMGKRGKLRTIAVNHRERFGYRVSKDYGNVFYKDYLKMVLGREFGAMYFSGDFFFQISRFFFQKSIRRPRREQASKQASQPASQQASKQASQ